VGIKTRNWHWKNFFARIASPAGGGISNSPVSRISSSEKQGWLSSWMDVSGTGARNIRLTSSKAEPIGRRRSKTIKIGIGESGAR
jgi:hypothetical protein